ncbi:VOC family protein [Actinotalea sp.]|uniref:VOC family protein n=1 Tax=Actinotalea sp. TaxID=1872145 RepID=UPI00356475F7
MNPFDDLPVVDSVPAGMPGTIELGAFSVSLDVADLDASRAFYEKLGFEVTGGAADQGWLILKNGETTLGLFHGMIEKPTLTFNPGLTGQMQRVRSFTDVREIQSRLEDAGLELVERADPTGTGPAHLVLHDPDGNPILIDQFF